MSRMLNALGTVLVTSTLLCFANVVEAERAESVNGLVGGDMASDCVTCRNRSKVWGECYHLNQPTKDHPKGATACVTDKCIQNYDAWVECNPKSDSTPKGNCATHNDPNATRFAQTYRRPRNPLTCGTDPGDLQPINPGTLPNGGPCNTMYTVYGKCLISCSGSLYGVGRSQTGMQVCGP